MKTVVLYEVESGDVLPKKFDRKNLVHTEQRYIEKSDVFLLYLWCLEEHNK